MRKSLTALMVVLMSLAGCGGGDSGSGDDVPVCGNGIVEEGEECDGTSFAGAVSCVSMGHTGGTVSCDTSCHIDDSACTDGPLLPTGRISAGVYHTCALDQDGVVTCWGYDAYGQCGTEPPPERWYGLCSTVDVTDVTFLAAGAYTSCAIKGDGTVWCWGEDYPSEDEIPEDAFRPRRVEGLEDAVQVSIAWTHICALLGDGTVWCWGLGSYGELGDGSNEDSDVPVQADIDGVVLMDAGGSHTCVLKEDGTMWCWGVGDSGELGDGERHRVGTPVKVPLDSVISLGCGLKHTCAVTSDGTLWCWGKLGVDAVTSPRRIMDGVLRVWTFETNTYVMKRDGTLWRVADPPEQMEVPEGFVDLDGGDRHACAIDRSGSAWCWGDNDFGQLGIGKQLFASTAEEVEEFSGAAQITAGDSYVCVLENGGVECWDGTFHTIQGLPEVRSMDGGSGHVCAVDVSGRVWCWGDNYAGQLGTGTSNEVSGPVQVPDVEGAVYVSAGHLESCALTQDATVWCWGSAGVDEMGDGGDFYVALPAGVPVDDASMLSVNSDACIVKGDGTVWCWNVTHFLAGSSGEDATPTLVEGIDDVIQVSVGGSFHKCAVRSDGTVWCWGSNYYGELGDGTTEDSTRPVQVSGLEGAVAVEAAGEYACAIKGDGTVWCWGRNLAYRLGDGTYLDSPTPVRVKGLEGAAQIALGHMIACVLDSEGAVWCWGVRVADYSTFGGMPVQSCTE